LACSEPAKGRTRSGPALVPRAGSLIARAGLDERCRLSAGDLAQTARPLDLDPAQSPDAFVLDAPMAAMGPEDALEMTHASRIQSTGRARLLVEHDMAAVYRIGDRIRMLALGGSVVSGPTEAMRADPAVHRIHPSSTPQACYRRQCKR